MDQMRINNNLPLNFVVKILYLLKKKKKILKIKNKILIFALSSLHNLWAFHFRI